MIDRQNTHHVELSIEYRCVEPPPAYPRRSHTGANKAPYPCPAGRERRDWRREPAIARGCPPPAHLPHAGNGWFVCTSRGAIAGAPRPSHIAYMQSMQNVRRRRLCSHASYVGGEVESNLPLRRPFSWEVGTLGHARSATPCLDSPLSMLMLSSSIASILQRPNNSCSVHRLNERD